jgi:undecaprenyl-diphosphatase
VFGLDRQKIIQQVERWLRFLGELPYLKGLYRWADTQRKKIDVRALIAAFIIFVLIFLALLSAFVVLFPQSELDRGIVLEVQEEDEFYLPGLMRFVSFFGDTPVAILTVLLASVLFFAASYRLEAAFVLFTFVADGVGLLFKSLIGRARPTGDLVLRVERDSVTASFPSGHVLHYVVFFGFLLVVMISLRDLPMKVRLPVGSFSVFLIALISISRMYLGVHWASDVIAGYLIGLLLLFLQLYFYFRYRSSG